MSRVLVKPDDPRFTRGLARATSRRANAARAVQGVGRPVPEGGEAVPGLRMPDTMIVPEEDVEDDWLDTAALCAALLGESSNGAHQKLYQFVKPGVLETYYVEPHMKRMFVVLDWDALRAADVVRRVGKRRGQ